MKPTLSIRINSASFGGRNLPIPKYSGAMHRAHRPPAHHQLGIEKRRKRDKGQSRCESFKISYPTSNPPFVTSLYLSPPVAFPSTAYELTLNVHNHPLWNPPHPDEPLARRATANAGDTGRIESFGKKFEEDTSEVSRLVQKSLDSQTTEKGLGESVSKERMEEGIYSEMADVSWMEDDRGALEHSSRKKPMKKK